MIIIHNYYYLNNYSTFQVTQFEFQATTHGIATPWLKNTSLTNPTITHFCKFASWHLDPDFL